MTTRALAHALMIATACSSEPTTDTTDAGIDAVADADAGYTPRGTKCVASDAAVPQVFAPSFVKVDPGGVPSPPFVVSSGGPVIARPIFVPITFDGDPLRDELEDAVSSIGCTSYWHSIVRDYGVGDAVMATSAHVASAPPAVMTSAQVGLFLRNAIATNEAPAPIENRSLYDLSFPKTTDLSLGSLHSCVGFLAYHYETTTANGTKIPFVVLPECDSVGAQTAWGWPDLTSADVITVTLSHELVEAVTDPLPLSAPAYNTPERDGIAWVDNSGGEIGDMCETSAATIVTSSDFLFMVQRAWSNRAAFTGVDPCQPSSDPFLAAVPALPDAVASFTGTTPGIALAIGEQKTIAIRLAAPRGWADAIDVEVRDGAYPGPPNLTFDLPVATGHADDMLELTVRRLGNAMGLPFEPFVLRATSRGVTRSWWAVVGDP
jgi:hypothetical protein